MRIILGLRQILEKFYILKGKRSYLGLELGFLNCQSVVSQVALPLKLRCPTQIIVEIMYFNSIQLCEIVLSPATANTKTNPNPNPNSNPGHRLRPLTVAKPAWAPTQATNRGKTGLGTNAHL